MTALFLLIVVGLLVYGAYRILRFVPNLLVAGVLVLIVHRYVIGG
jgi:hypothetical protein